MNTKKLQFDKYADEVAYNGGNGSVVKIEYSDDGYKPSKQVCGLVVELRKGASTNKGTFTVRMVADDDGKASITSATVRKALAFFNRERMYSGLSLYEVSTLTIESVEYVAFSPIACKSCYPFEHVFNVSGGDHSSVKAKANKAKADTEKAIKAVASDASATIEAVKKADTAIQSDALKAIADARSSTVDFTKIEVKKREEITKFCKSLSDDERAYLLSVLASYKK